MYKSLNTATDNLRFSLTNDYLFHVIFQKNLAALKKFICSLLNLNEDEIIDIKLENPIDLGTYIDDKEIILDLRITLNNYRRINIEMQVINEKNWPERSLTYLCRSFDHLEKGTDYENIMQCIHIGILDFTLFPEHPEFYAQYAMMNINKHHIYSDKLLLNVLDLTNIDLASNEDINCGLQQWARLFKAKSWEEIKMLAIENETFEDIYNTMQQVLADKDFRLKCEARERYERDRISAYASGKREGVLETTEADIKKTIEILRSLDTPSETICEKLYLHYNLSQIEALDKINQYSI